MFARLCLCMFLSVILTTAGGLGGACYGAGATFSDVEAWQWHAGAVERARAEGILEGYPDGTFRPDRVVTCGEFLRMAIPDAPKNAGVHWADGYYREGLRRGLFTERDIRESSLERPMARQHMALVYSRLLEETDPGLTGIQIARTEEGTVPPAPFSDVEGQSAWEYPVAVAAAAGLLEGYPDGTFRPEGFLTRAEAATAFVRLLDLWDEAAAGGPPPAVPGEAEPDPLNIEEHIDLAHQNYLDSILESLNVYGANGDYSYSFEVPESKSEVQVLFRVSFYNLDGGTLFNIPRYTSRDSTSRKVMNKIIGLESLETMGSASFNFSVATKNQNDWHDYLLKWRSNGDIDLRMQLVDNQTGRTYEKFLDKELSEIFTWS